MPRLNGKGPQGEGNRTGRGLGRCGGKQRENNWPQNEGAGRGRGCGRGLKQRKGRAMS